MRPQRPTEEYCWYFDRESEDVVREAAAGIVRSGSNEANPGFDAAAGASLVRVRRSYRK
jgi:hypothetical protein